MFPSPYRKVNQQQQQKTAQNTLHHSLQNVNKIPFAKWQPCLANHTFSRFGNLCTQQIKNIKFTSVIINHNYITDSIQLGMYVYVLFVFAVCFFSLRTYPKVFPSSGGGRHASLICVSPDPICWVVLFVWELTPGSMLKAYTWWGLEPGTKPNLTMCEKQTP